MVFDKKGEFVPGLQRQNFRVFEDGVEQQITSFDAPTQLPLNIALLIDTSSSVKRKLKFEKEAAAAFVMSILERSVDRALLATFDSVVTLHVDFSRDSGDLTRSIDTIKAGGNTRLYDAIYRVCEEKMAQLPPGTRPVMLVITDGADVGSDRSLDEAIAMAKAGADIIVPHMGLTTGGTIGAETAVKLEQCPAIIDGWAEAAMKVRKDIMVICHGGPISSPSDAEYVLKNSQHVHGFYGASSMERLPTEIALTAQTKLFKSISF